jgi:hypothetical protein
VEETEMTSWSGRRGALGLDLLAPVVVAFGAELDCDDDGPAFRGKKSVTRLFFDVLVFLTMAGDEENMK